MFHHEVQEEVRFPGGLDVFVLMWSSVGLYLRLCCTCVVVEVRRAVYGAMEVLGVVRLRHVVVWVFDSVCGL